MHVEDPKQWLKDHRNFSRKCLKEEYTEVNELWDIVDGAAGIIKHLSKPRTLCIEVQGGVVVDVYGLPVGWTYDLADWDNVEEGGLSEREVTNMIRRAKKLK